MAVTIWSDSAILTRGSFAPWAMMSGARTWPAWKKGEIFLLSASSFSASPTRRRHSRARVGDPLGRGCVAPGVAGPRPAVDVQNQRQALWLRSRRQRQVGHEVESVARLDDDRLHPGEGVLLERGP